jgi:hypothetical protein
MTHNETSEVFVRRNGSKYEVVERWSDGEERIVSTFDTRQDANEYAGDYRKNHA